ncbi:sterol 24-C-methyltransferase [Lophiotrema nucula]|uniref:Sterol 24-C-methyltransferase n=1 Tax=Lophiotrema nucula TaxID=690887 RepID=A0A6A5ZUA6_9PLEO|nr:sterol 24-C-methyltransferase [Lophiotrema nucula]
MESVRKRNEYSRHWEEGGKALVDDEDARDLRKSKYSDVVNDYYNATTDIYLESWGQSFHMARYPLGPEPKDRATARHEHYLALMMSMRPGMRILDVGCGVGGPAKEIATFVDCHVVGINNNGYQVHKAQALAKDDGSDNKVEFVQADFVNIPFPDDSFDAIYAIEATVHAPELSEVYKEIFRVLKPGGTFGVYEWLLTDAFSPNDKSHMAIRLGIERGTGVPSLQTKVAAREAMNRAGFKLEYVEDLAERQDPLMWWYPISGDLASAKGLRDWVLVARNTRWGRVVVRAIVRALEFVKYAPKGTTNITEELIIAGDSLVAGGKAGIFTPMYLMIGKKVLEEQMP